MLVSWPRRDGAGQAEVIFHVGAFTKDPDHSAFGCGKAELDEWLLRQAGQQERTGNTRTFLAVAPGTSHVVGYYATTTYRLELHEAAVAFGVGKSLLTRNPCGLSCWRRDRSVAVPPPWWWRFAASSRVSCRVMINTVVQRTMASWCSGRGS